MEEFKYKSKPISFVVHIIKVSKLIDMKDNFHSFVVLIRQLDLTFCLKQGNLFPKEFIFMML